MKHKRDTSADLTARYVERMRQHRLARQVAALAAECDKD